MWDDTPATRQTLNTDQATQEDDQYDCALDLMRRLPPQNVEDNLNKLLDLVDPDLEDKILSAIDKPLKVKRCPKTGKDYLLCDYNRDGDSYRQVTKTK